MALAILALFVVIPNFVLLLLEIDILVLGTFCNIPLATSIALLFITLLTSFVSILYEESTTIATCVSTFDSFLLVISTL